MKRFCSPSPPKPLALANGSEEYGYRVQDPATHQLSCGLTLLAYRLTGRAPTPPQYFSRKSPLGSLMCGLYSALRCLDIALIGLDTINNEFRLC